MKKALSFILAIFTAISAFALPTFAYTYDFEDSDIRNCVDPQVLDLEAKGEAKVAPTLDGVISDGEYSLTRALPNSESSEDSALNVSVSAKNGALYVAFAFDGETEQSSVVYNIGVSQYPFSDSTASYHSVGWSAEDKLVDYYPHIYIPRTNSLVRDRSKPDSEKFLADRAYKGGVYEARFDLTSYYKLFANTAAGKGIYDTPCVTLSIEHTDTLYAFAVDSVKIDSAYTAESVPFTVIIPSKSLEKINEHRGKVGTLGYDWRNAVSGQLAKVGSYAESAPTLDGYVGNDEYTVKEHIIKHNYKAGYGDVTANYAVGNDGYFYAAFSYAEAAHSDAYLQIGLSGNNAFTHDSRISALLSANGEFSFHSVFSKDASEHESLTAFFGTSEKSNTNAFYGAATSHTAGVTTYEVKISIAKLIALYEYMGWEASDANCISVGALFFSAT